MNFSNSGRTSVHLSQGVNATLLVVPTSRGNIWGENLGSLSSLEGMGVYEDRADVVICPMSPSPSLAANVAKASVDGSRNPYVNGITRGKP